MGEKYIHCNILGCYVFNKGHNIIDSIMVDSPAMLEEAKARLKAKHKDLEEAKGELGRKLGELVLGGKDLLKLKEANMRQSAADIRGGSGPDQMISEASRLDEELERQVNTLAKRLREWADSFYPAQSRGTQDHVGFAKSVISPPGTLLPDDRDLAAKARQEDLAMLRRLSQCVVQLAELQAENERYLNATLKKRAPNMVAISGVPIGAKLLSHAGSLERLAKMPASTIQLIGAERSLFRHLRNPKSRPPKYGFLHEHPLVQSAPAKLRGKVARSLADKLSIAIRVDRFGGEPIGEKLYEGLKKKFSGGK